MEVNDKIKLHVRGSSITSRFIFKFIFMCSQSIISLKPLTNALGYEREEEIWVNIFWTLKSEALRQVTGDQAYDNSYKKTNRSYPHVRNSIKIQKFRFVGNRRM